MDVLLSWGEFQFSIESLAYDSLSLSTGYRWVEIERILRNPASQYMGAGSKPIKISGVTFPQLSKKADSLKSLRELADKALPYMLTSGGSEGRVFGEFVLTNIDENTSAFLPGGQYRKNSVSLSFEEYGRDKSNNPLLKGDLSIAKETAIAGFVPNPSDLSAQNIGGKIAGFTNLKNILDSGITPGNLTALALPLAVGDTGKVPDLLNKMGLQTIGGNQSAALGTLGVNAAGLRSSFLSGNGAIGTAIALTQMAKNPLAALQSQLPIIAPGLSADLQKWVGKAEGLTKSLNVDPKLFQQLLAGIAP